MAGRERFRVNQADQLKMDQVPGFPQEELSGGGFVRLAVFVNPFPADAERSVLRPEDGGIADAQGNDGVGPGNPAFGEEDSVVFFSLSCDDDGLLSPQAINKNAKIDA